MGRTIATVLGVFLLLGVLAAGACFYWLHTQGPKFDEMSQAAVAEATGFGKQTDNQGCLEESLERYDRCENGFTCHVRTNVFFLHCLQASAPVPGFCDGVPADDSLVDAVTWRLDQCKKGGRSGTYCGNFYGQIQKYCDSLSREPAGRHDAADTE